MLRKHAPPSLTAFFHCCSQIADPQHPRRKGRVILAHCLRVQPLVGKTLQQMWLAAGHVIQQSGSIWDPSPWDDSCLRSRWVFSHPLNHCENIFPNSEVSSGWFQLQSMWWWGLTITTSRPDLQAWFMHLIYTLSLSFYAYLLNNRRICAILSCQKLPILHVYSRSHHVVVLYHLG